MSWRPAGRGKSKQIKHFLEQDEWKHVPLAERIRLAGGSPRFGQISDGRLWLKDAGHQISGGLFISRYGVVLPAHNPEESDVRDREFLRRLLVSRRDRLFSTIGTQERVIDLEERIGEQPADFETYRMLTGGKNLPPADERPPGVILHKAGPADMERLWPLEKAYQYEEVLRKGSVLNERSGKAHFLETLKKQLVVYAVLNGRPVAKAGTNARGWKRDQIGGVFVIPELRGCGFGRTVMMNLLEKIHSDGRESCLFVKTDNQAALGLYKRLRFTDMTTFRISYWSN